MIKSDGGSTSYYELPGGATELNDLIEYKNMSFALGNIFKACYRLGEKDSADTLYDLNKIVYFANRLIHLERMKNPPVGPYIPNSPIFSTTLFQRSVAQKLGINID